MSNRELDGQVFVKKRSQNEGSISFSMAALTGMLDDVLVVDFILYNIFLIGI